VLKFFKIPVDIRDMGTQHIVLEYTLYTLILLIPGLLSIVLIWTAYIKLANRLVRKPIRINNYLDKQP